MPTVDSTIWADKHRPDTLSDVRGNEQTVDLLSQWVDDDSVPNLLFAGPAGTGKTASAVAFAKDKFGDAWQDHFLQLNASDDRGIDVVRNEIKKFARLSTVSDYQFKLIFLDESDSLCLPPGTEVVTGYPSSPEVKPIEEVAKNSEPIPSVDFETNELQSDRGKMLETGTAEFYDIEFADGREVTASTHHPFFVVGENEELQEIEVQDLSPGDEIADFRDEIGVVECEVCGDWTGNSRYCSMACKNDGHSELMKDPSVNHTKGKDRPQEVGKRISEALSGDVMAEENNPNWNGDWHGPSMSEVSQEKYEEWCANISEACRGKELTREHREAIAHGVMQAFNGEVSDEYEYQEHYRELYLPDEGCVECEICNKECEVGGRDGIYVHHIDGDRENNKSENLMAVCPFCHNMICHDKREKFIEVGWKENENRPDPQSVSDGGRRVVDTVEVESVAFSHSGKAYNITMEGTPNFMLANGLLTHNTRDAQPALRRIMEDYSDRTRFILSCNFPSQIIDPIQSRCSVLRFEPLADAEMESMLEEVLLKEDVTAKHDQIEQIVSHADGDARTAMHTLQSAVVDGAVKDGAIEALTAFPDESEVRELLNMAVQGDDECMARVDEMLNNGVDVSLLLEQFVDAVRETDELPADARMKMLDKIGECEYRVTHGSNPRIQMHSLLADIRVARHLSLRPYQQAHNGGASK